MARILVIDDVPQMRKLIEATLEAAGHEVVCAGNGKEGLAIFSVQPADLVITDLIMPETEGMETIQQLRAVDPALKILAISGAPQEWRILEMAENHGAHKTLAKPFKLEELANAVETLLRPQAP